MLFRDMKRCLAASCIFLLICTHWRVIYASNPSAAATSTLTRSFGDHFHEAVLKRRDSPYLQLPIFQHSRVPLLDKQQFSPARGSGREPLPEDTQKVLVPHAASHETSRRNARTHGINVACHLKKMIVKVNKQILGPEGLRGRLKLGTCDVSKSTKKYHLFLYDMDQCGGKRKLVNNRVTYSNMLHYSPVMTPGPVRRAMPFSIEVQCHFNRYHYSYKSGFTPQVNFQSYFRPLKTVDSVVLTPRDALWRRLSPTDAYTIGHPMYFQADGPPLAEDKRLFVDSCYVTVNSSPVSTPRFTVIENHGCMTDSKSSRWSRFIPSEERNVVQFSLDAFQFQGMLRKQLHMHCEISVGSINPTPSSKLCTYNQATKRWEELYGVNGVCSCCDSQCLTFDLPVTSQVTTSDVWTMETEQTITSTIPREVDTDRGQIIATFGPEIDPHHYGPGLAVVEKEDELVKPRIVFEEIFGLD